jgi:hypothetical protein
MTDEISGEIEFYKHINQRIEVQTCENDPPVHNMYVINDRQQRGELYFTE